MFRWEINPAAFRPGTGPDGMHEYTRSEVDRMACSEAESRAVVPRRPRPNARCEFVQQYSSRMDHLHLTVRADRNPVLFSCLVGETAETCFACGRPFRK